MEQVFTSTRTLRIAGRQAIAVPTVRGSRVEVTGGRAWLTIERDERDFVLPSGGVFDCDIDGLLVIEMLDEGTLTVAVSSLLPMLRVGVDPGSSGASAPRGTQPLKRSANPDFSPRGDLKWNQPWKSAAPNMPNVFPHLSVSAGQSTMSYVGGTSIRTTKFLPDGLSLVDTLPFLQPRCLVLQPGSGANLRQHVRPGGAFHLR